jgi:hypothetical protein
MFKNKLFYKYMDEAGEGTNGAGGDTLTDSEKAEATAKAEADKTAADKAKADADAIKNNGDDKKPSDSEAKLLKEVMQRKEAQQKSDKELLEAKKALKQFEGIDADEVKKLISEKNATDTKALEDRGEWDRLKARMGEEHVKETGVLKATIAELTGSLEGAQGSINELTIGSKFNASIYIKNELLLTPSKTKTLYGGHFDYEDGNVVGYDKPRGATGRTAFVDSVGSPLSFEESMQKIIASDPEKDSITRAKVKTGADSGSDKSNIAPTNANNTDKSGLERISEGLKGLKKP